MTPVIKIRNAVPDSSISRLLHQFQILWRMLYQGYVDGFFSKIG